MAQKKRRLGKGLSSLMQTPAPVDVASPPESETPEPSQAAELANAAPDAQAVQPKQNKNTPTPEGLVHISPADISPSPFQPRRVFDEEAIGQLASSIRRSGLMQPVIVRPTGGGYQLVAGERRWRAAQLAELSSIPAVVRSLDDEQAAEWGLVENIQREDLNPMERAHGLRALGERFDLGPAELGERVGLERSTVANLIRLTELEAEIQAMVSESKLSMGHARALLSVAAGTERLGLASRIVTEGLSVRAAEEACRRAVKSGGEPKAATGGAPQTQRAAIVADIEKRLSAALGTKAHVRMSARGNKGRITLEFYDLEHFEDLMSRMGLSDETA